MTSSTPLIIEFYTRHFNENSTREINRFSTQHSDLIKQIEEASAACLPLLKLMASQNVSIYNKCLKPREMRSFNLTWLENLINAYI